MPVSTGIGGGAYAVGDKFGRSLGVEVCRAPGCSVQKTCLWHRFLIKYPQYVVWDPNPKKVELEKRKDTADFGFKFKVKIFDGPQEEVFALVTEVTCEGVAWNHLLPGDWIRSINGTAVITPKEAMNNFSNLQSLKLMIQRPASLSQKDPKGVMRLKQLAQSLNIRLAIPPPPPSPDPSLSGQQQSPATEAPNLKRGFAVSPSEVAWQGPNEGPLSRYDHDRNYVIRTRTDSGDSNPSPLSDPLRHQCPSWNGGGGSPFRSGCPTVVHRDLAQLGCLNSAEQTPVAAWSNNGAASTAHASHAASTASAATCPDKFLLPRARVVVCGAHGSAADFVKAWLVDIGSEINPDPDECVEVFHFSVTHHLETHRTGRESAQKCAITVNSAPELLSSLVSKQRMCNGAHCQSENGEGAVGASSLGHTRQCYGAGPNCSCVGSRQMNIVKNSSTNHAPTHCLHTANPCNCDQSLKHSLGSGDSSRCLKQCWCMDIVNVELYVINDEEFFHHCASWLLPTTSLVILTFHDHKILMQAEAETRRLSSLVHTVRASTIRHSPQANGTAATNSNGTARQSHPEVLLYGVPPSGSQQEHSVDEIQAIFYVTSCGCLLLNHHGLSLPEIVRPQSVQSVEACGHKVWQVCREALLDTSVHSTAVKVADALSKMNVVSMTAGELHVLVSQVRGQGEGELATSSLKEIEDDLLRVGSLVVGGSSTTTTTIPSERLLCPTNPQSEPVYLLPHNVLRQLASLVICPHLDNHTPEIRQRWFRVMTTGRATGSDLADLFTSGDLSVEMLERLGVVFRFQSVSHSSSSLRSSGFSEGSGTEFLFPYFLAGLPGEEGGEVASESTPPSQQFVLIFNGYVSWAEFYSMLGRLSTQRATEVAMRGQCDCVIKHEGLVLTARWKMNSDCDSIIVSASRANGDSKEPVTAQDIERLFSCVAPLSLPFTLRRADDSSLSSDLPAVQSGARRSPSQPDSQETSLKNRVTSVPDSPENRPQVVRSLSQMPLSRLSWSTISEVARFLTIPMPTGHDWRSVAERAGKRMVDIVSYEQILSHEVPAMNFFREWMTSGVSVQTFIDILKDLDRPDVVDIILNHLRKKQCLPSDSD